MKRRIIIVALLLAAAFSFCACGSESGITSSSQAQTEISPQETQQQPELAETPVTDADGDFDTDFLNYVNAQHEKENFVVSPLSFRVALALAVEGADNDTRLQLLDAMGFSSGEELDKWYGEVTQSVTAFNDWASSEAQLAEDQAEYYPPGEAPEMPEHAYKVLNSIWNNTASYSGFLPDYIQSVGEKYDAAAYSASEDQITDEVNHWCDESTNGLIPKISDDLSQCAAILINAVYLKSSWVSEFYEFMTEPENFTDIDGNTSTRDMMKAMESYRYYEDENTKLVVLPLNGGLDFVAVLGDASGWNEKYDDAAYTDVDLWIPKLDTESSYGEETLIQYLKDHGAVNAFDSNTADFSRMADYPWYISDIIQKAKIKTDEDGLEAAAVTMISLAEGAALEEEEPKYKEFHADKPFRYYVVTSSTQVPLVVFAGQEVK